MKHGRRPTRKQKMIIKKLSLNPDNWLVVKCLSKEMLIIDRKTQKEMLLNLERI